MIAAITRNTRYDTNPRNNALLPIKKWKKICRFVPDIVGDSRICRIVAEPSSYILDGINVSRFSRRYDHRFGLLHERILFLSFNTSFVPHFFLSSSTCVSALSILRDLILYFDRMIL